MEVGGYENARGDEAARAGALAEYLTWPQFASKSPRNRFFYFIIISG